MPLAPSQKTEQVVWSGKCKVEQETAAPLSEDCTPLPPPQSLLHASDLSSGSLVLAQKVEAHLWDGHAELLEAVIISTA